MQVSSSTNMAREHAMAFEARRVLSIARACAKTGRALQRNHLEIIRGVLGVSDEDMREVNVLVAEAICEQIQEEYREEL